MWRGHSCPRRLTYRRFEGEGRQYPPQTELSRGRDCYWFWLASQVSFSIRCEPQWWPHACSAVHLWPVWRDEQPVELPQEGDNSWGQLLVDHRQEMGGAAWPLSRAGPPSEQAFSRSSWATSLSIQSSPPTKASKVPSSFVLCDSSHHAQSIDLPENFSAHVICFAKSYSSNRYAVRCFYPKR